MKKIRIIQEEFENLDIYPCDDNDLESLYGLIEKKGKAIKFRNTIIMKDKIIKAILIDESEEKNE